MTRRPAPGPFLLLVPGLLALVLPASAHGVCAQLLQPAPGESIQWGCHALGTVDAAHRCPADADGDRFVGQEDLSCVLAGMSAYDARCDFDLDGRVDCFDLELVLGNWGPCPLLGDLAGPGGPGPDGCVGAEDVDALVAHDGQLCQSDLNCDGDLDAEDVDVLLCLFGGSSAHGDLNGDGVVDSADLAVVLARVTPGSVCLGDLNGDGVVAVAPVDGDPQYVPDLKILDPKG